MSSNSSQEAIKEITDVLYPQIGAQITGVYDESKSIRSAQELEVVFDIFDELRCEFLSLCKYETKLVYPALSKFFEGKYTLLSASYMCLTELQLLISKKEAHINELALQLEVEARQAGLKNSSSIFSLVSVIQDTFIMKKNAFHKLLLQLQWNEVHMVRNHPPATNPLLN